MAEKLDSWLGFSGGACGRPAAAYQEDIPDQSHPSFEFRTRK